MWGKSAPPKPSSQALDPRPPVTIAAHDPGGRTPEPAPTTPFAVPRSAPVDAQPSRERSVVTESRIASSLQIRGEIFGDSDLLIDGQLRGKIQLPTACVTIGANGRIQADIEAREIIVHGQVEGSLKASESVRLGSTSRVQGNVLAPRIRIDDGAHLRGTVETVTAQITAKTAKARDETTSRAEAAVSVGVTEGQVSS